MTSFMAFQTGAAGQLDRAIGALLDLDRAVRDGGDAARAVLGSRYDMALVNLAAASLVRYQSRRELLLLRVALRDGRVRRPREPGHDRLRD
jgi:hypothetical protein